MDVPVARRVATADPFDGLGAPSTSWLDAAAPALTGIDAHAHVFVQGLSLAAQRRYAPDHDATLDAYVTQLSEHGLSHGVLVQPSFLGADNAFLAAVTKRYPQRFRGVAVVDPQASDAQLEALADANVVGARLNLIGLPVPDLGDAVWTRLFARLNALGWHVEVHSRAADLPAVLDALLAHGCTVVVDHFGRPDPALGVDDRGFRHLLSTASTCNVWVKLSAAYRSTLGGDGTASGAALASKLLDAFGAKRLVWGSDWPHTQHRQLIDYAGAACALQSWIPDEATRRTILTESPAALFRF
jgi:predicted TIM-barrel fold metal-dependent hydrolase